MSPIMPCGFNYKKVLVPFTMSWGLYSPNLGLVITLKRSFKRPSLNLFPPNIVYCKWNAMNIKLYNYQNRIWGLYFP